MPQIVTAVQDDIGAQVARGETPDGEKWKLRIADGGRPLKNAAAAVSVTASRGVLLVSIDGHHAKHHLGAVKGKTRRRILPSSKTKDPYGDAIRGALTIRFRVIMGSS